MSESRKRSREDGQQNRKKKAPRPTKKQRQIAAYHSDSDSIDGGPEEQYSGANLIELGKRKAKDVLEDAVTEETSGTNIQPGDLPVEKLALATDAPTDPEAEDDDEIGEGVPLGSADDDDDDDEPDLEAVSDDDDHDDVSSADDSNDNDSSSDNASTTSNSQKRPKSKRNDPSAFATSLSKILSTKLTTTRRSDPVLSRSAAAQQVSRQQADAALELKARKKLREQKKLALEKGRVRDVLVATNRPVFNEITRRMEDGIGTEDGDGEGEGHGQLRAGVETTAQIMEMEKRLRKTAMSGVKTLFNAVRAAQVKAAEADKANRSQAGSGGIDRKQEKVTEMSRRGFLELIAAGGGGLKSSAMEEA